MGDFMLESPLMKVVVLGASGGCGHQLVKQAVERGYEVTAVGRSSSRLDVPDLLSRSAPLIVAAMKRAGVPRLLAISAGGVGDSAALMPWFYKWIVAMTSMRRLYPELEAMESVYASSDLDVCCVRPTSLTDGPRTGRGVVATRLVGQANISRADVANWMLDAAEGDRFEHFGPILTERGSGLQIEKISNNS